MRHPIAVKAQFGAGFIKPLANQVRPDPRTLHALAPGRVVNLAAMPGVASHIMHLTHPRHHARGAVGVMQTQPFLEQGVELPRQPQHGVKGAAGPSGPGGFEHVFHVVVDERYLRRHAHPHRYACFCQRAYRAQAPVRGGGARLQRAAQGAIKRGDCHVNRRQTPRRHGCQQVNVALHATALGDDGHRLVATRHHLQRAAGEL